MLEPQLEHADCRRVVEFRREPQSRCQPSPPAGASARGAQVANLDFCPVVSHGAVRDPVSTGAKLNA
jgi:hypothetical protein